MEWLLIFGMMVVTFGPRYLPFALAGKIEIPLLLQQALAYVPVAVLTTIIATTAMVRDGEMSLSFVNHHLVATICAFAVALAWKNLFLTISVGLVFIWLQSLRYLI